MKKIVLLFLISAFMFTSCAAPLKDTSGAEVGLREGQMAPDFTLKNIDGKDVKLSEYRGKVVLLNFFGVWCPWCVKEMPGFANVYNEYKEKGVELLVVDVGDSKMTLLNYLKSNNFEIKPVLDSQEQVSALYKISGFPTTYVIDEQGVTQKIHRGYMDENNLRSILDGLIQK